MKVTLVGMGMGREDGLSARARTSLCAADAIIGAPRLLRSVPAEAPGERIALALPEDVARCIGEHPEWRSVCVALSGDPGYHSGGRKLAVLLADHEPEVLCGHATPQYFAALLRRPWDDLHLVSAHGTVCDPVAEALNHPRVLFLTGGAEGPACIAHALCAAGLDAARLTVGENLSYPDERLTRGTARELRDAAFAPLAAVLVENDATFARPPGPAGIPDDDFLRGDVPMTKREVRAVALSLLGLTPESCVWDVGAGTGSVAVEAALQARRGRVYAVEDRDDACRLIESNRERFGVYNLRLVHGRAPAALAELPPPDAAYIGGSGGELDGIVAALTAKNPAVRIVVGAVTLETVARAGDILRAHGATPVDACQVAVTRTRAVGAHTLFAAQNPVVLIAGGGHHA